MGKLNAFYRFPHRLLVKAAFFKIPLNQRYHNDEEHATSVFPHFSKRAFSWRSSSCGKHTTEMGKQCNVSSLLCKGTVTVSQCTNTCQRALCTSPAAFTRSFQGNFLPLETRWWWCSRCRSAVDKTLEMLPQYRPRCSTFSYKRIV